MGRALLRAAARMRAKGPKPCGRLWALLQRCVFVEKGAWGHLEGQVLTVEMGAGGTFFVTSCHLMLFTLEPKVFVADILDITALYNDLVSLS